MAAKKHVDDDEQALHVMENVYAGSDEDTVVDPAALARMRRAIDHAFDRAWKQVHDQAEAEARAAAPARRRRSLAGWARDALLARLAELEAQLGPQLQLAHRHLAGMSDADLRALVEDVEANAARLAPGGPANE